MEFKLRFACHVFSSLILQLVIPEGFALPAISMNISNNVMGSIGNDVKLECSIRNAPDFSIHWMKIDKEGGSSELTVGSHLVDHYRKMIVDYKTKEDSITSILEIYNFQITDAGTYDCVAKSKSHGSTLSAPVEVIAKTKPVISVNSTLPILKLGKYLKIECHAHGIPSPKISWEREGNLSLSLEAVLGGNILMIPGLKREDRGVYSCVAKNDVGETKHSIDLKIEIPPVVTVFETLVGQTLNNNVDLVCYVDAFPFASIVWRKDKKILSNDAHHSQTLYISKNQTVQSVLHLSFIQNKHFGNYSCEASNILGTGTVFIELYQTGRVLPRNGSIF